MTQTCPAIAAGTCSTRPSIAPPALAAMSIVCVRSLSVIAIGPTTVGDPAGLLVDEEPGPEPRPGLEILDRISAVGADSPPEEFVAVGRDRAAPFDRGVDSVPLLTPRLPGPDAAPAEDRLAVAGDDAGHPGRLLLRLLALDAGQLDDDPGQVLPGRQLAEEHLAVDVSGGGDGDVILFRLAFVGDAEPPGLGLLEFAQSPHQDERPVGVAIARCRAGRVSIGTGLPDSASRTVPWIS